MKGKPVQARPAMGRATKPAAQTIYRVHDIVDAEEHHEYARAMGLLTWNTWDIDERSFDDRLKDFIEAYPPASPAQFQGSMLARNDRDYGPAPKDLRLDRLVSDGSSFGALPEVLARYGLKLRNGPHYMLREIEVTPF